MIIDLSSHNVANVKDWNQIAGAVEGVILRCGYRGYLYGNIVTDSAFEKYVKECTARNIPIGLYFMSQAMSVKEAQEEADFCIMMANKYGVKYPIYFDSEWSGNYDKAQKRYVGRADFLTKAERTKYAVAFCDRIESKGFRAGVYASRSWFVEHLDVNSLLRFSIWVAQYNSVCKATHKYDLWQYTSSGRVAGISGDVDCSHDYAFNVPTEKPVATAVCPYAEPTALVRIGSIGNGVKWVQWQLKRKGYDIGRSGVNKDGIDGIFGKKCADAVFDLQKKAFTNPKAWDKIVGANTRAVLKA